MTPSCALPGCNKPLPKLAIQHEDEFCSNTCARQAFGVSFVVEANARERACIGCGGAMDEQTEGCESCRKRRVYRQAQKVAA